MSSLNVVFCMCVARTRALIYGELARMSTHFGDRKSATKFLSCFLKQDALNHFHALADVSGQCVVIGV